MSQDTNQIDGRAVKYEDLPAVPKDITATRVDTIKKGFELREELGHDVWIRIPSEGRIWKISKHSSGMNATQYRTRGDDLDEALELAKQNAKALRKKLEADELYYTELRPTLEQMERLVEELQELVDEKHEQTYREIVKETDEPVVFGEVAATFNEISLEIYYGQNFRMELFQSPRSFIEELRGFAKRCLQARTRSRS